MPAISNPKKYDLVLTPQFYISKKESLPIKFSYQALKLAPSVLDDLVSKGDYDFYTYAMNETESFSESKNEDFVSKRDYDYAAFRDDEYWDFYAYDINEIESFLKSKNLDANYINKIYFSQQSKDYFKQPVSLNDKNALITIDDTVVILAKKIIGTRDCYTLDEDFRPLKSIPFSHDKSSLISKKNAFVLTLLMTILSLAYVVEGIGYAHSSSQVTSKLDSTKSKYPSLQNKPSMVLNSIYNSTIKIDTKQRKIRDIIKKISHLSSKDSKLDSLNISNNNYEASISADKNSFKHLKAMAKKDKLSISSSTNSFVVKGVF